MSDSYKSNIKALLASRRRFTRKLIEELQTGIVLGLRSFESKYVQTHMTGKRSDSVSATSGDTKGGWSVSYSGYGDTFMAKLATTKWYLQVHQHAGNFAGWIYPRTKKFLRFEIGGRIIFAKKVYIPKRLHILEDYQKHAANLIYKHMRIRLRKALISV